MRVNSKYNKNTQRSKVPTEKYGKRMGPSAADGVGQALKILEGKWKLVILFHLFGGNLLRFFDRTQSCS